MPVDISMERLSETFIPLESSESSEVRRIHNFIAALGKPKNIIFWLVLIVSLQLTTRNIICQITQFLCRFSEMGNSKITQQH